MSLRRNISKELADELRALTEEARTAIVKPNVLIVEDQSDDAMLLEMQVKKINCHVDIVNTPEKAVEYLDARPYSLVFLDLKLAERDGVAVLAHLKANYPNIPVIVVSGYIEGDIFNRAKSLGYFGIIEKPLDSRTIEQIFTQHNIPIP
jgi:DNA-binding NtrC family response regulator